MVAESALAYSIVALYIAELRAFVVVAIVVQSLMIGIDSVA